jgi:hypothetical protein
MHNTNTAQIDSRSRVETRPEPSCSTDGRQSFPKSCSPTLLLIFVADAFAFATEPASNRRRATSIRLLTSSAISGGNSPPSALTTIHNDIRSSFGERGGGLACIGASAGLLSLRRVLVLRYFCVTPANALQ